MVKEQVSLARSLLVLQRSLRGSSARGARLISGGAGQVAQVFDAPHRDMYDGELKRFTQGFEVRC